MDDQQQEATASAHERAWPSVLEWAEKQGTENLKARFATADILAKEAQSTLTVLLAGIGGSAAYVTKLTESTTPTPTTLGFAVVCGYFVLLSVFLIVRCMRFESYPALYQEPVNLTQRGYSLDALREVELENLTERIREAKLINDKRAAALNNVRLGAAFSPVVLIAATILPNLLHTASSEFATAPAAPQSRQLQQPMSYLASSAPNGVQPSAP